MYLTNESNVNVLYKIKVNIMHLRIMQSLPKMIYV